MKLWKPISDQYDFADLTKLGSPRFIVTVDTEEEFDWGAPFSREQRGVKHIKQATRFQNLCQEFGVKPVYLVDHPIASNAEAVDLFGDFAARGKASIGVHLHPWVNPPFVEQVNTQNSYSCNLPPELEREKLELLHGLISEQFGIKPIMYRAGRYGAGEYTPNILRDLGIVIDSSVRASFDYSADTGPNYALEPVQPFWLARDTLLELPVTTVFAGKLRNMGQSLFGNVFSSQTARSILSRTSMLERIALTPEGISLEKAILGIEMALEAGIGILNFSFHSPSLAPGFTPYVRNEDDLESFYAWWRGVFTHLERSGVRGVSIEEVASALVQQKKMPSQEVNYNSPHLSLASSAHHPLSAPQSGPVAQLVRAGRS